MSTIFISGSRLVSHLPAEAEARLHNVVRARHRVIVGDANGVDKAVQRFFLSQGYKDLTVFCSGIGPRNNLGDWETTQVAIPGREKGFQLHALKDRAMAREAEFGLMIWDGKSVGTVMNALRLLASGKIAVIYDVVSRSAHTLKSLANWRDLVAGGDRTLWDSVWDRATAEERHAMDPKSPAAGDMRLIAASDF